MTQTADIQCLSLEQVLETLHSEAQQIPTSSTSSRYLRALETLKSSAHTSHFSDNGQRTEDSSNMGRRFPNRPDPSSQRPQPLRTSAFPEDSLTTYNSQLTTSLTDWLINQWLMNTPFSTASLYLDIISALYGSAVKAGRLPKTDLFSQLKTQLKTLGPEGWKSGIDNEIFARALRLTKNAAHLIAADAIAADLVILSLTHALRPLEQIALLKREDIMEAGLSPAAPLAEQKPEDLAIFNNLSLANARRVYVFLLRQSERTPAQLKKHVFKIVNALFKRARLPQATDPNQTVEALWAYAALRAGVPASVLVSYLGHAPLGLPVLKLCKTPDMGSSMDSSMGSSMDSNMGSSMGRRFPNRLDPSNDRAAGLSQGEINKSIAPEDSSRLLDPSNDRAAGLSQGEINKSSYEEDLASIGKIFLENPPLWYAMSLRPGVRFPQLSRRISLLQKTEDSRLKTEDLKLFYPCEEITRAIGKKIVIRQRPFIHSVVFFKAKLTDIGPLFAKIGDLAWCYRQSARPGAPYAHISEKQFQLFQQTIANFTPDYEVASTGELEIKEGDRVEILGGLFTGHQAIMEGRFPNRPVPSDDCATGMSSGETAITIYRLNIIGDNGIEWRINVDSRLTAPSNMGRRFPNRPDPSDDCVASED